MRKIFKAVACSTAVAALLPLGISQASAAPEFAEGRILVKPAAGLSKDKFDKILKKAGTSEKRKLHGLSIGIVETPKGAERALVEALSHNPNIDFAQLDYKYDAAAVPNDTYYGKEWHLPVMQAPDAWNYSDGTGVTVAVLDTGVNGNHPDLSGKVLNGWNTVSNNSDASAWNDHGTAVAGVIAANTNNGIGVASTAPGTKILPIRITNDGFAYSSDMAEGITWAANKGARVANISFSGAAGDSVVANAASQMMNKGGIVVVAAANDNADLGYSNSPYLFVAAATNSSDTRASFSNYGKYVDVSAPGESIITTNSSGGYWSVWGTSFSAPNVAAVVALVMATNPSLTPADVLAVVSNTADDLGSTGWDPYYGHGRVNALAAVELAANVSTVDTSAPNVSVASPGSNQTLGGQVAITVNATDDFGVIANVDLLIDGVKFASETQGQNGVYLFSWDSTNATDGMHRIGARAVDAAGNIGAASEVYVTVSNIADSVPPTAYIDSPADGATVSGNVSLSGFGKDDQAVAQFSLSVNGKIRCSGTSNAACNWNTRKESDGTYTISAKAVDQAGNVGTKEITVTLGSGGSGGTSDGGGSSKPGKGAGRGK